MPLNPHNSPQESVLPQTKHLVSKEPEVEHGHTGKRDDSHPGWDGGGQCDFIILLRMAQNFKLNELLICGIFHLVFSDCH